MAYLVAIDAGHGGFGVTPGKRTPDGEYEWNFNNKVAVAAIAKLKANGVNILRTDDPTGKTDVGLTARTNKANRADADIFVSIHHNANTGKWGTHTGTETFTMEGSQPKSEKLAKLVHAGFVKAYGLKDRGLKKENFAVLRQTTMPAILLEGGYMDSTIDIKKMRSDAVLKAAGEAIADGVLAYFGIKPKVVVEKPAPTEAAAPVVKLYRVRKTWADAKSQIAAFESFAQAKECADGQKGYRVYDTKGVAVYVPDHAKFVLPTVMLEEGSANTTGVTLLQRALTAAGFTVAVDGDFGPATTKALKAFQSKYAAPADGVAGPATYAALNKLINQ